MKKFSFFLIPLLVLVFTLSPSVSSGQTPSISELKSQIETLMKQIQALQAIRAGQATTATTLSEFTTDLGVGSSGSQVVALQQFLVSKGFLVMPAGVAYGYYGNLTAVSVKKFQTSQGISSTGFIGPMTRIKLNSLRGTVSVPGGKVVGGTLVTNVTVGSTGGGGGGGGGRSRSISIPSPTNPTYPAPRVTLVSNTYNIVVGSSATLSWTTGDTTSCGASGSWSGSKNTGGSETVSPVTTSTYTLSCTGPGGSAVQSVTISVTSAPVSSDTTAPSMSNGSPSGTLSAGTTQANITLSTNESATCRLSQSNQVYGLMGTQFTTTGGTTHSYTVSNLSNSSTYTYFARCADTPAGNQNSSSLTISFSIGTPVVTDTTAPTASITAPTASQVLSSGTTQTTLTVTTNENASCRFNSTDIAYSPSTGTAFTTTGGTTHSTSLTGLSNGTSYTRYVRCADTAGNAMTASQSIAFSVASASGGGGGGGGSQTGAPYTPVFFSDWRTAPVGTISTSVNDGGKWSILGNVNEVVANSGLNLSLGLTNVLRVPGATGGITRKAGMPVMQVGVPRNYRLYFRNDMAYPTTDTQTHPFQDGNAGSQSSWTVNFLNTVSAGQIQIEAAVNSLPQGTGAIASWRGPNLTKGTWYLLDWQIIYRTSTTFNYYIRISDVNGNVLYDSDDFMGGGYGGYPSMSLATFNNSYTFNPSATGGISASDGLNIGTNDNAAEFGTNYGYQAAVAVVDGLPVGSFIGPYGNVVGETVTSPTDTTAPTVSVTAPTASATVSGSSVTVSATASDAVGVSGVQFLLDGSNLGSEDTTSPYSITWDSTTATNASHTITARAHDAAGNTTVSSGVSVTVNNNVGGGGGGGGGQLTPVFFSDWRTVTLGDSANSVTDNCKWSFITCSYGGRGGQVIAAPTGFPTANALQVTAYKWRLPNWQGVITANDGYFLIRKTGMPIPAIGTTRNYRFYYRHDQPNHPTDNGQHPIQDGNAGSQTNWNFGTYTLSDTTWQQCFYTFSTSDPVTYNSYLNQHWCPPNLQTGVVYRFEFQVHRIGETTLNFHARVYDSSGNLIHGDANYTNASHGGTSNLSMNPTIYTNAQYGLSSNDGLNGGLNGITSMELNANSAYHDTMPYAVQAGFAVVDGLAPNTFIGPYGSVLGEQ